jgi:phosphoribosylaminoimidazole-succinocarboxamide synthase
MMNRIMKFKLIIETNFEKLNLVKRGKVRDIYDLGEYYLIVSTDRLSAFDVIMTQGIPYKGMVLTTISRFWFEHTKHIIENHLITTDVEQFPEICMEYKDDLEGRSMLVKKAEVVPVEAIVRGYISGSGWNDYKKEGKISGIQLPEGLKESEKLEEPIFTPSTKAELGLHDETISFEEAANITGNKVMEEIKTTAISIYKSASEFALTKGIIVADTKMEFGIIDGKVILVDELLTPDSSRFWPLDQYSAGKSQLSYDKQFVRDYLLSINFNKQPPPPDLPEDVIIKTSEKYLDVLHKLTGAGLS